jgi:hypothetical protein
VQRYVGQRSPRRDYPVLFDGFAGLLGDCLARKNAAISLDDVE